MPILSTSAKRAATTATTAAAAVRPQITRRYMAHYDSPSGQWLFGVPPGTKMKEGWENMFYFGFAGSLVVATIAYAYKPDTSIQTWALEEARRRLESEGIIPDSTKPVKITDKLKTVSGK